MRCVVFKPHVPEIRSEQTLQFSTCTFQMSYVAPIVMKDLLGDGARDTMQCLQVINIIKHLILIVELYHWSFLDIAGRYIIQKL